MASIGVLYHFLILSLIFSKERLNFKIYKKNPPSLFMGNFRDTKFGTKETSNSLGFSVLEFISCGGKRSQTRCLAAPQRNSQVWGSRNTPAALILCNKRDDVGGSRNHRRNRRVMIMKTEQGEMKK
ncbi:hypothetical protein H5410_037138 [Solanum commersonii]|uniref:Transmembrane protein n=1 Tax=Solanum commersonii TaxID=4109 RepID=A0A9J5Y763_SOLCO|nr:hypothetical protein H5410_037138 [Solanum commersonii]